MKTSDFEKELQKLDPRLVIVPNPHRKAGGDEGNAQGISNVKLDGVEIIPVPSNEISDEPDMNSRYVFPNGHSSRHKCRQEVLAAVKSILERLKTDESFKELFFERN